MVASYVVIFITLFMGKNGMVFRLNFIVTSLCVVIGLCASATYASEGKSRPLHIHCSPLSSGELPPFRL
ncbi:hypothetical protein, partial [Sansalvadorimonas verongulae]|uniref:hypothetical protein n=1 Tax=Sansalvadorimonas verongulae TaxID=2172824 RepID=UPI001E346BDC